MSMEGATNFVSSDWSIDEIISIFLMCSGDFANENGEMVISEEEFQMIRKLKELKASYRQDYDELRQVKSEVQYCQKLVDQCRQRLISGEEVNFTKSFKKQIIFGSNMLFPHLRFKRSVVSVVGLVLGLFRSY